MRGCGGQFGGARDGLWREKKNEGEKKEDSAGSRKRGSMETGLGEDLTNSASSPLKSAHQTNKEEGSSDAKKKLFEATGGEQQGTPSPPPQYVSPRDKKK
jgi:hypothetical protein